jgi:hypothetical protein
MFNWQFYNGTDQLSYKGYTEEEVRHILANNASDDSLYAMNSTGDIIETHDGPITVARVHDPSGN